MHACGGRREGRSGGREWRQLFPCLEAFISVLKAGILGEGFSRISISSPGVPFQGRGLHWLVHAVAESHQSLQWVLASPICFCCFSGPAAERQLRPRFYLCGGDLYLAVNSLASLFSHLSQFSYSTCPGLLPVSVAILHTNCMSFVAFKRCQKEGRLTT